MMDHALAYARQGLPVFPIWTVLPTASGYICACGKAGCENKGKHPLGSIVKNGLSDASTDPEKVKHWWTLKPDANIGLVTGTVVVLDVRIRVTAGISRLSDSKPSTVLCRRPGRLVLAEVANTLFSPANRRHDQEQHKQISARSRC